MFVAVLALPSIYLALLLFEFVLWRRQPRSVLRTRGRGLYVVQDGYVLLKPGIRKRFDDGYARGEIVINSLGFRGHEPCGTGEDRVLILGDSFAFGELLDQNDTIDACLERLRPGCDAINLGLTGYNLPEQLEPLRRWTLPARHVVYLFYGNDLESPVEQTIVDGYRVRRRRRPDGALMSDEEMLPVVARQIERIERSFRFLPDAFVLPRARTATRDLRAVLAGVHRDAFADDAERAVAVERGVQATEDMRALAVGRGMTFTVVVVPSLKEMKAAAYQPAVVGYLAGLAGRGIAIVDLLQRLSGRDYWHHDGHLRPRGALIAARAIDEALAVHVAVDSRGSG